ncbi:putative 4-coumarate--CoA ligase 5 [Teratosphaeria destructans]|uniref:4-coumarate--CoA ligase 5 n=1 Tax=Teratosphaeria destructans TaxID=418781 RepID=A0A9W7VY47_9PEZI|nr:putative 4-coumarate--CoA ligase 5 [Teratosphaeria destructans]
MTVPEDVTTWQWAFESAKYSSVTASPKHKLGSYINAATKERLDFSEVKQKATQLSAALIRDYDLKPGDTVSLFSTNTIWYPVAMWATLRAGGRVNGASPAYTFDEVSHALRTASTKFVFTLPSSLSVAVQAAAQVGLPKSNIFLLEGEAEGFVSLRSLIGIGGSPEQAPPPYKLPRGKSNKEVCGYLNFSSGTTGRFKAVMLSHHNIIAQCHQLRQMQVVSPGTKYQMLAATPLFHITGLVRSCHYPVLMNGNAVMLPAFNMETMIRAIIEYQVEELILVPPIIIRMVRDPVVDKYLPDLQRIVKRWSSGSAPTAPEIIRELQKRFPATGFRQGYGATESTACISCHPPSHYDYKYAHTGGLACANTLIKVIDIDDPQKELGPNQTGEICAKGPQIAMGYLDNPSATAETFRNGWLHTGDIGHLDEEGLIHISDRIKEMIKVKGQQVAPAELEDLLLGHELVEDCAVLGIPDLYAGERPKAYVVLKPGVHPSADVGQRLLAAVKGKKVRYKWIQEIEFIGTIPKSQTGKLLRRVLKTSDRDPSRAKGLSVRDSAEPARL